MAKFTKRRFTKKRSFKKRSFKRVAKKSFKKRRIARKPISKSTGGFTTETIAYDDIGTNSGAPYSFQFSVTDYPRATAMMAQFKYYRCTRIEYTYEALWNVYHAQTATGTAIAPTVPQAYWRMDRNGTAPFQTVADFQDAGAKPIPLTRKIKIAYTPNVITQQFESSAAVVGIAPDQDQVQQTIMKPNKWLSTVKNSLGAGASFTTDNWSYNGHQFIIDQLAASGATNPALTRVVATAHWQFKDPFINVAVGPAPVPVVALTAAKAKTASVGVGGV